MRIGDGVHSHIDSFFLLLLVFIHLALGGVYAIETPVFEKPDEPWHYAYVEYIIEHKSLPPLSPNKSINPALQIAAHPPLYYVASAALVKLSGLNSKVPVLKNNPFNWYIWPNDNRNCCIHYHIEEYKIKSFWPTYLLRFFSLLLSIGAIIAAYRMAHLLKLGRSEKLAAAALVSLNPQFLFISSSVSNDALEAALSAIGIWLLMRAVTNTEKDSPWILFSLVSSVAVLTKNSGFTLIITGLIVSISINVTKRNIKRAFVLALYILSVALVITGWWYFRNLLLFNDPLGTKLHELFYGRNQPLTLKEMINRWFLIERSFWGEFGWGGILLPKEMYTVTRIGEILGIVGLGISLLHTEKQKRKMQVALLLLFSTIVIITYIWWTRHILAPYGRLLFPALAPIMILLTIGLKKVSKYALALFTVWIGVMAVISPHYINKAYARPKIISREELPAHLQKTEIRFDEFGKLVAFSVNPRILWPGGITTVTLCWLPISKTDRDFSVFIHMIGDRNKIVSSRYSYPGLGSYPTSVWQPGGLFCDNYTLKVPSSVKGPALYKLIVGFFDFDSKDRSAVPAFSRGQKLNIVSIGLIKVRGTSKVSVPVRDLFERPYNFGNKIVLLGASIPRDAFPGRRLKLSLFWKSLDKVHYNYTVTIRITDNHGKIVAQNDSQPQGGKYPTSWWDVGEVIRDEHTILLPRIVSQGRFHIVVGLYRRDDMSILKTSNGNAYVDIGAFTLTKTK